MAFQHAIFIFDKYLILPHPIKSSSLLTNIQTTHTQKDLKKQY
jgi:hypothetical protein